MIVIKIYESRRKSLGPNFFIGSKVSKKLSSEEAQKLVNDTLEALNNNRSSMCETKKSRYGGVVAQMIEKSLENYYPDVRIVEINSTGMPEGEALIEVLYGAKDDVFPLMSFLEDAVGECSHKVSAFALPSIVSFTNR